MSSDAIPAAELSRLRFLAACGLFLISGAAALIYEVSWARQIGEVLGHTARTAGVVLAAYFVGLAAGYEWGGRWAARTNPLRGYAAMEALAALWALAIPSILGLAGDPAVARWLGSSADPFDALWQSLLCLLLLLPSTVALGATLPLMAQFLSPRDRSLNRAVIAYVANTLGAMLGVAAATGWLLMEVGVSRTSFVAAGMSLACAAAALLLDRTGRDEVRTQRGDSVVPPSGDGMHLSVAPPTNDPTSECPLLARHTATIVAAASGFAVLALEVLYIRLFSLVFHNSSYSFGSVIAVFLLALSLGAALAALLARRLPRWDWVTFSLWTGGVAIPLSVWVFAARTEFAYFQAGDGFREYLAGCALLAGMVMLPPVLLAGMTLPGVWREAARHGPQGGEVVGRLSTINTLAGAAGSLAASFLLLPWAGLWPSFATLSALLGLAAVLRLLAVRRIGRAAACAAVVTAAAGSLLVSRQDTRVTRGRDEGEEIVRRWETAYGWIDVVRDATGGSLDIRQNLHYRYGSTGADTVREQRQAHLPLLLHPRPDDVLFLGLGTGVTAAGATLHDDVRRITVVELIPEVVEAVGLLGDGNLRVLEHPRVTPVVDDARHFLLASDARYDVIVGDLFVPWESETGYLYTREHFERVRSRLKPGGLCCQWLALYQLGESDFTMIADTFAWVFPHASLWWGYLNSRRPMVALIGCDGPPAFDTAALETRLSRLRGGGGDADSLLRSPAGMAESFLGVWTVHSPGRLNTVEHPWIEFHAPWSHQDHRLLSRGGLRRSFEATLSRLPALPVPLPGQDAVETDADRTKRINVQRFILFGEDEPPSP